MWFKNLVVYRLAAGWSRKAETFEEKLAAQPLRKCGGFEMESRGWVPPREIRLARVRDLTRWNDARDRTVQDVLGLLATADRYARDEMVRLRDELGLVVSGRRERPTTRPAA